MDRVVLIRRAVAHDPRLVPEYFRWALAARRAGPAARRAPVNEPALDVEEALQRLHREMGPWAAGPHLATARAWRGRLGAHGDTSLAADSSLGEIVYGLVRALRPTRVIETGVATGVTSAFALAALADNDAGELWSIDLPPAQLVRQHAIGAAVPTALRGRWHYHWGTSRRLLPGLLGDTADRRPAVFVHDSDHSYRAMRWELETAAGSLRSGDWLVGDDVELHSAFADVAADLGSSPLFVAQADKPALTGLLRLP
jgi:hypothetical protein